MYSFPLIIYLLGIQDWKTHLLCPFWRIGMAVLEISQDVKVNRLAQLKSKEQFIIWAVHYKEQLLLRQEAISAVNKEFFW